MGQESKPELMSNEPECEHCKDPEGTRLREAESLMSQGWLAHYIIDDSESPFGISYHTHGFEEAFDCPNVQVVLLLPHERIHEIVHSLATRLKDGIKIVAGQSLDKVLAGGFLVTFAKFTDEDGKKLLRMIIPDAHGKLEQKDQESPYCDQWLGCDV